jgi:hypothetical protein
MHILIVKLEGKIPLGKPVCKREYNIKVDLRRTVCDNAD